MLLDFLKIIIYIIIGLVIGFIIDSFFMSLYEKWITVDNNIKPDIKKFSFILTLEILVLLVIIIIINLGLNNIFSKKNKNDK